MAATITLTCPFSPDDIALLYKLLEGTGGDSTQAGGTINGGSIQENCDSPFILGTGGTITLTGVALSGNKIAATGGGGACRGLNQPLHQASAQRTMKSRAIKSRPCRQREKTRWTSDCKASMRS
jgi:hypothetical protein